MMGTSRTSIRALNRGDLPAVRRLCRRLFPGVAGRQFDVVDACASRKRTDVDSLGFAASRRDRIVGILSCRITRDATLAPDEERVAHLEMIGVTKSCRRQGIATKLWRNAEGRLRGLGVREVWTRSRVLGPGVEVMRYPPAMVLLMNLGFCKRQYIEDLTADLTALDCDTSRAERKLRGAGVEIKRIEYDERVDLERFLSAAFPVWLGEAGRVTTEGAQRVHIARTADAIVGFAVSDSEWFGPIGVHSDYRRRGIAKTLLLRCLNDMREHGQRKAEIGWANTPFYARAISAPITRVYQQMAKRIDDER